MYLFSLKSTNETNSHVHTNHVMKQDLTMSQK